MQKEAPAMVPLKINTRSPHPQAPSPNGRRKSTALLSRDQRFGLAQIHTHQLRHAALCHGDAEEAVHAGHGDRIMGDGDEARVGLLAHLFEEIAEAFDIVVVERGVHFVQHADGRRIGEEHREDERHGGQRLFATGQKRHGLRLLAGRAGDDFKAGFQRII